MLGLLFSALIASTDALVPQVSLCDYAGCPQVSRIGLGTLHLGDKIGGTSDPKEINAWLQNGLAQGITLVDTADVYPVKGGTPGDSAKLLGEALALTPGLREKLTIVAKVL
jgi:aryl-alcohol dehydrogenase-like predicted oxidoreductase